MKPSFSAYYGMGVLVLTFVLLRLHVCFSGSPLHSLPCNPMI